MAINQSSTALLYVVSGTAYPDCTITIWELTIINPMVKFRAHDGTINSIAISFNSEYIISGSADSTVKIWKLFS